MSIEGKWNGMDVEHYVKVEDLEAHLGKSRRWIYANAERLDIPRYRIGNHLRFKLSEVDHWMRDVQEGAK